MAYPNFGSSSAGYPAPTSGIGVPAVVGISGTGVSQLVVRQGDGAGATGGSYGSFNAEKLNGQTGSGGSDFSYADGVQFVAPLAKNSTLQLSAYILDSHDGSVTPVNNFTYRSLNSYPLSVASFRPPLPNEQWLPNRTAPTVPAGQTGPGAGNGLVWNSDVVTVDSNGLLTANDFGFAIVEVRYPKSSGSTVNDFIYATLLVTVTEDGTDVE